MTQEKFKNITSQEGFKTLPKTQQIFLQKYASEYRFSVQNFKQLVDIAIDLNMWNEKSIDKILPQDKQNSKEIMKKLKKYYQELKNQPIKYDNFKDITIKPQKIQIASQEKDSLGFGLCPVASNKTRCCNLLTLDVVESCGFDCSYCSIQSFYNESQVNFNKSFTKQLQNLKLDPNQTYHVGTGQSSDSLMWGNRYGVLDTLVKFAKDNPNVILEFKTKSKNIEYLLSHDIPKNIICTYSLNPQIIIDHEEHLTSSLDERLQSAKKLHDSGIIVGFHFHPMVYCANYQKEYGNIFKRLVEEFDPFRVAMVSFGTLTFTKSTIKKIRQRDFKTKVLQIPLTQTGGKFSYPDKTKIEMFKYAYKSLKKWHKKVFFYLCMEDESLWREVFGFCYPTNESFEMDMKLNYFKKISQNVDSCNQRGGV